MKLSPIIYSFVLFVVLIVTFFGVFIDGANKYSVTYNKTYSSVYLKMNDTLVLSKEMGQRVTNQTQDELNAVGSQTLATGSALRLIWESIGLSRGVVSQILQDLEAPPLFYTAFLIVLSVAILFTFISLFFRRET